MVNNGFEWWGKGPVKGVQRSQQTLPDSKITLKFTLIEYSALEEEQQAKWRAARLLLGLHVPLDTPQLLQMVETPVKLVPIAISNPRDAMRLWPGIAIGILPERPCRPRGRNVRWGLCVLRDP